MAMPITKARKERIDILNQDIDTKLSEIKSTYENSGFGFDAVAANGFSRSNLVQDLNNNVHGIAVPEESEIISLGNVNGYETVNAFPLKGNCKNGVKYADPNNPAEVYVENNSNTLVTDRADENLDIDRWTSRTIFKFKSENYGYDRCVYVIPIADLANGFIINSEKDTPHGNTLKNYPYPEEIIMTSQKTEKNFIHFINVQYTDSHYGHFNGRNYNLMIVKNRTRYGVLDESGNSFKEYTSVYANDVETELAYIDNGYLYLPVPSPAFGEEMLNTLWDCRVIWRSDAPDRNISVNLELDTPLEEEIASWKEGTIINDTEQYWSSICYGNGKFVAVAYNSNIFAYSTDGINWTEGTISNTREYWYSVCYGDGKFVAVANDSIFAYSTDGINWTEGTISDTSRRLESVCYGNGKFVAVAFGNMFAYSTDGINWTEGTISDTKRNWYSVCYGDGKFVAVANDTMFAYSTDGINWTEGTISDTSRRWYSVCYGDGKFVAVANDTMFAYSTDGINWTEGTISDTERDWESVCYGDGKFVAVAVDNTFAYSNIIDAQDFYIIDDRIHLVVDGYEYIGKSRNSVHDLDNQYIQLINPVRNGSCVLDTSKDPSIIIAPSFNTSYSLLQDGESTWLSKGTPNQIFKVSDDRYLGFYYNDTIIDDGAETQLYWCLFDSMMKTVDTASYSDNYDIYPCKYSSSKFTNSGKIIKIFVDNINPIGKFSSFFVFTESGIYRFTFDLQANSLAEVPVSIEILSITPNGDSIINIMRISKDEFWILYSTGEIQKVNISDNTGESLGNISVLFGRTSAFYKDHDSGSMSSNIYDSTNTLDIVLNDIDYNISNEFKNTICHYGLFKSDGIYKLFKLVERYTFDKELDPPYLICKEIYNDKSIMNGMKMCYGNGIYVAISWDSNNFLYSYDCITWNISTLPNSESLGKRWDSICYGDDKFVAISNVSSGNISNIAYSIDGIIWNIVSIYDYELLDICYGDGKFVISTARDHFYYSIDAISWTSIAIDNRDEYYSICYGNSKFISAGYDGNIAYSTDGIVWSYSELDTTHSGSRKICYGNGKFIVTTWGKNTFSYSTDGINWTDINTGSQFKYWKPYYNGKEYIAIHYCEMVISSTDGIKWYEIPIKHEQLYRVYDICHNIDSDALIVGVSNGIIHIY